MTRLAALPFTFRTLFFLLPRNNVAFVHFYKFIQLIDEINISVPLTTFQQSKSRGTTIAVGKSEIVPHCYRESVLKAVRRITEQAGLGSPFRNNFPDSVRHSFGQLCRAVSGSRADILKERRFACTIY